MVINWGKQRNQLQLVDLVMLQLDADQHDKPTKLQWHQNAFFRQEAKSEPCYYFSTAEAHKLLLALRSSGSGVNLLVSYRPILTVLQLTYVCSFQVVFSGLLKR